MLWGYRTTPRRSTGRTPFSLTFDIGAIIPLQVGLPIIRTEHFDAPINDAAIANDVDLAEKGREKA